MPLPKNLPSFHIAKAVEYVERGTAELIDIYLEQANVFSAIVGIYGTKALHAVSPLRTTSIQISRSSGSPIYH